MMLRYSLASPESGPTPTLLRLGIFSLEALGEKTIVRHFLGHCDEPLLVGPPIHSAKLLQREMADVAGPDSLSELQQPPVHFSLQIVNYYRNQFR